MTAQEQFIGLNGLVVSREEIARVIDVAKSENDSCVIYRLSRALNNYPDKETFEISIAEFPKSGLNAPRHKGSYKVALDDCGRLKPGFRFVGGQIVQSVKKAKKNKALKPKSVSQSIKKEVEKVVPKLSETEKKEIIIDDNFEAIAYFQSDFKEYFDPIFRKKYDKEFKFEYREYYGLEKNEFIKEHIEIFKNRIKQKSVSQIKKKIDLDKANPKSFANKPKSVSVASAIKDLLQLPKYKSLKPMQATVLYKIFKDDVDFEDYEPTEFESGVLSSVKNDIAYVYEWGIVLHQDGKDFVNAVTERVKSLKNQKHNYAMFDGLAGTEKKEKPKPALRSPIFIPDNLNKNSVAYRRANRGNVEHEYYEIPDQDLSEFFGKVEKKKKESVAITIKGGQGSMKTRLCFRIINALAQNYKVGHASIEEHPESELYEKKVDEYLNPKAQNNLEAPEINTIEDIYKLIENNDVIVIDSFTKIQEMQRGIELDKDFRKKYDGKLFIIIFQETSDGKMRGGSKSQFDGDIICDVYKQPNYEDNYVQANKNRYQSKNLEELKYNIFRGQLEKKAEENKQETNYKPVKFSFDIIEN